MRSVTQGIENQLVETLQQRHGGIRNLAEVRQVGRAAKAKTQNFHVAVEHGYGSEGDAKQFERTIGDVELHAGHGAERGLVIEDVGENAADDAKGFFVAVDRKRGTLTEIERANVVKAKDVV